jgi:DNA-binding NtrC family response regulator
MLPFWKVLQSFFVDRREHREAPGIPVVALINGEQDRNLLRSIGNRDHLDIYFAETCGEAWNAANRLKSPVVLCDRDVPGMEWQDLIKILASAVPRPCVILTSTVVDDYLWHEIVANGGYDVIASPLRDDDVTRSIRLAFSYWKGTSVDAHSHAFRH